MIIYSTEANSAPYSVAVADFNNDTQLDIVVTNSQTDCMTVIIGYGNRNFAIISIHSAETRSRSYTVAIDDFNNDNIFDIAVANSGTNNIFIFYGYGNETSYAFGYGYRPYSIAVTDLN